MNKSISASGGGDRVPARMNAIFRQAGALPESPRALPLLLTLSAFMMGALFIARINADLNYDGQIYIGAAMKFWEGSYRESLRAYPMPVYPVLIAAMHYLVPNWVLAGRLVSLCAMTLTLIPLYRLAHDLFGSRPAFWCCLVYILLPETLRHSNSVLRDPVFLLLYVSATCVAQHAMQSQKVTAWISTALLAVATTLFRVEGLVIFPVCLCVFLWLTAGNAADRKRHVRMALTWAIIAALLMAVFVIAVGTYVPGWFNRYSDWEFYYNGISDLSLLENYQRIADSLLQIQETSPYRGVGHHVAATVKTWMPLVYLLGLLQMLTAVVLASNLIFLLWGLIRAEYSQRHVLVLALAAVLMVLAYGFFVRTEIILQRYLLVPAILLLPWVGFGIDRILGYVQRFAFKRLAAGCIVLLVIVIPAAGFDHFFKNSDDLAVRAGDWVARHEGLKTSRIVFNDQVVKFHTEIVNNRMGDGKLLLHLDPSDTDFSKLARYAQENSAEAIVIQGPRDGRDPGIQFPTYAEVKELTSKRKSVKIYVSRQRSHP